MVNCRKSLTIGLLAVLFFSSFAGLACADAGWLDGYSKRMLFYWQSSGAGQSSFAVINQTNFNVANTFYIFNETQPDFEDLNVTLADGVTPLALWNQTTNNGVNCTVWANFPTANTSYYLYWGKPEVVAGWNQSAVFNAVLSNVSLALPMDEGSGVTLIDYSQHKNNASITGASWVEGKFSSGLSFNGITDFVRTSANFGQLSNITMCAWVKPSVQVNSYCSVVEIDDIYLIRASLFYNYPVSNQWQFRVSSDVGDGSSSAHFIAVDEWHFIVGTYDGSVIRFYYDGVEAGSGVSFVGSLGSYNDPVELGMAFGELVYSFTGVLDNVFIFDKALSSLDVFSLYEGFGDATLERGNILIRSWITDNSINLFGVVESAPVPVPSVDPDALTAEDGVAVAVAFGVIAIALCVGLVVGFRSKI